MNMRKIAIKYPLFLVLAALLLSVGWAPGATAQTGVISDPAAIEKLIEDARARGARVVVIEAAPGASTALAPLAPPLSFQARLEARALEFRERLAHVLSGASSFLPDTEKTLRKHGPGGGMHWVWISTLLAVFALGIGYGAERLYSRWARPHFAHLFNPVPESRAEKIAYLLFSGLLKEVGVIIQGAVAVMVVFALGTAILLTLAPGSDPSAIRVTQLVIIGSVIAVRFLATFFSAFMAVGSPSHRMIHASDEAVERVYRGVVNAMSVVGVAVGLCLWMQSLELNEDAHKLGLIGATLISSLMFGSLVLRRRADIAAMLLGAEPETRKSFIRTFAQNWHSLAIIYIVSAFVVTTVRLILNIPDVFALVTGPMFVLLGAITVYGVALLIIEWGFNRDKKKTAYAADGTANAVLDPSGSDDDNEHEAYSLERHRRSYQDVAEHAAAIPIIALATWTMFRFWGVDVAESGTVFHAIWEVFLIAFLAWLAFEAVDIAIDRKIEDEGGYITTTPGDEGGSGGISRVTTLLPLLRNFMMIVIITIAGMIALSEMGVDIAPLFASAGVLGLAIGFGAQSLIRDIFSGAFFLFDDAFRIGEYIDLGSVKGTVEKISIRSMQLRHHRGALHTIPFGEINHLTNYSRDWVMMKLPLRVAYDTDVDKVRKIIKNLGKDLMSHPDVGHLFLQPLKSQGVFSMEESAMIVRVKYMTKPGDQFMTRKVVYAEISKLFAENGIEFAHRQVTVHVAGPDANASTAAAGGAAAAIADGTAPAGGDR